MYECESTRNSPTNRMNCEHLKGKNRQKYTETDSCSWTECIKKRKNELWHTFLLGKCRENIERMSESL